MLTDHLIFREVSESDGQFIQISIPPILSCLGTLTVADLCAIYDVITMKKVYDKIPDEVRNKTEGILLIPSYNGAK